MNAHMALQRDNSIAISPRAKIIELIQSPM